MFQRISIFKYQKEKPEKCVLENLIHSLNLPIRQKLNTRELQFLIIIFISSLRGKFMVEKRKIYLSNLMGQRDEFSRAESRQKNGQGGHSKNKTRAPVQRVRHASEF